MMIDATDAEAAERHLGLQRGDVVFIRPIAEQLSGCSNNVWTNPEANQGQRTVIFINGIHPWRYIIVLPKAAICLLA